MFGMILSAPRLTIAMLLAVLSLACAPLALAQTDIDTMEHASELSQPETTDSTQTTSSEDDSSDTASTAPEDLPEPSSDDYGAGNFKAPDNDALHRARDQQTDSRDETKEEQDTDSAPDERP